MTQKQIEMSKAAMASRTNVGQALMEIEEQLREEEEPKCKIITIIIIIVYLT